MMQTKKWKSVVPMTTGILALDELLGETLGEFRSGKTQLAHTLCVSTQLPVNMRGGDGKVAYIEKEGAFRPDCIVSIAEKFGMDPIGVHDDNAQQKELNVAGYMTNQGINAGDLEKLQDAEIYAKNGLMMQTKKHSTCIQSSLEAKIDKICEVAEILENFGYPPASDILLKAIDFDSVFSIVRSEQNIL